MTNDRSPTWGRRRSDATESEKRKGDALALLAATRETVVRRARRALIDGFARKRIGQRRRRAGAGRIAAGDRPEVLWGRPWSDSPAPESSDMPASSRRVGRPLMRGRCQSGRSPTAPRRCAWLATHPDLPPPADADQGEAKRQGILFQETATPTGDAAGAAL